MADTTFSIDINAKANGVDSAATSLANVTTGMTSAAEAAKAADAAVRAADATYRSLEGAADRAAKAVEKISLAADAQREKMRAAQAAGDGAGYARAAAALDALNAKQAAAATKADQAAKALDAQAKVVDKLKGNADATKKAQESMGSGKVNEIAEGLGKLGGPLGVAGQKAFGAAEGLKKLGASLGSAGPYVAIAVALTAVAASVAAVTVAAAAGVVSIAAWSIGLADAARTQGLLAAGIARTTAGGEQLTAKIDDLIQKVPASRDELMGLAKTLADGGLRGKQLTDALQTAAVKAAKLKFGPDFQEQLFSLPSQAERLKGNIAKMFGGLKITPFLKALDRLGELFDQNNASGRAIKAVFESMFQPLIDGATDTIPKLRTNFIAAEIAILRGLIQLKHFTQEWGSTLLVAAKVIGILTAIIVGGLLIALAFVVVNLALIGAAFGFVIGVATALIVAIGYLGAQIIDFAISANNAIVGNIVAAFEYLRGLSLAEIGTALMDGLVAGITAGGSRVLEAVKNVAKGAIDSAKKALGVASPSKVFAEIGGFTAEGMTEGVEGGTGDVKGALETMVSPPDTKMGAPSGSAEGGGDSSGGAPITLVLQGIPGADGVIPALMQFLQDKRAQLGAAAVEAAAGAGA